MAYRVVGPYGDGPFGSGYRRIASTDGRGSTLVRDIRYGDQTVRAVIDDRSRRASELRLDLDADGLHETTAHVDPAGRSVRLDRDLDGDGVTDRREYYEDGAMVRAESDDDGDGRFDTWSTWVNGVLVGTGTAAADDEPPDGNAERGRP